MSPKNESKPLDIDLQFDDSDLEPLFEPFDIYDDRLPVEKYPELPDNNQPHDPIDWEYLNSLRESILGDLIDVYFRAEIYGAEKIPEEGAMIIAPNHSGTAFPHDAMVLDSLLWRDKGYRRRAKCRSVYSPQLAAVWWMRPFGLDNWWRRGGGVDMTFKNYDSLLAGGDKVIYYPEGVPGIGKGFNKRYQLQHYYSSFVVLAARNNAPVYPVSVINAEWVNPTSITFEGLNNFFSKHLGLPFLPIPTVFLTALLPFVFYLSFPCKMVFLIGDPIDARKLLAEEGAEDPANPDRETAIKVAERVRQFAQKNLNEGVKKHGKKPYDIKGFWKAMKTIKGRRFRMTPFGWPFTFIQHDRDLNRPAAKNGLHKFLRDWDILFFYVPFGWLFLALTRRLRKAPYGYRGMTKKERLKKEGSYRWLLDKRPLLARKDRDFSDEPS